MIEIIRKAECCGCNACVQRCPKQCISMREDEEGFLYPIVDVTKCIDCSLCEKVCPVINQAEAKKPIEVFAVKNRNEEQRLRSSSGGVFILLAEQIIRQGGVVFGARFDANWEVEHCYAETLEELPPLMRSKYMQSKIGDTYKKAETFLKLGRKVLFVGTPCQIAGLRKFLRKEYDSLLAVDFICHGVPSPGVWRKYLKEITSETSQSEAAGKNTVLSLSLKSMPVITGINFREKQLGGYGWKKFGFVVHGKSPSKGDQNSVLLSTVFNQDTYMKGFLRNLYLRPSCYECRAKGGRSSCDITIGDFWGIDRIRPEIDDDKGVGAVLVHSKKGSDSLSQISFDRQSMTYEEVTLRNPAIHSSVALTNRVSRFWKAYTQSNSVEASVEKALKITLADRAKGKLNRFLTKVGLR